jgi:hypothetical protein
VDRQPGTVTMEEQGMDALVVVAVIVIGLVVFGLAAITFGVDSRDDMVDDHRAHVQPLA